jgi:hypothetical protein
VVRAACFSTTPGVPSSFMETNSYFINDFHTVRCFPGRRQIDDLLTAVSYQPIGSLEYFVRIQLLRDEATGRFNEHGQRQLGV